MQQPFDVDNDYILLDEEDDDSYVELVEEEEERIVRDRIKSVEKEIKKLTIKKNKKQVQADELAKMIDRISETLTSTCEEVADYDNKLREKKLELNELKNQFN